MTVLHGALNTRILVGRDDVTPDATEIVIAVERPVADATGFGMPAKQFVKGQHSWTADLKGWYNLQGTVGGAGTIYGDAGNVGLTRVLDSNVLELGASIPSARSVGFFPEGFNGTVGGHFGSITSGWAGIAQAVTVGKSSTLGNAVAQNVRFQGTTPLGEAQMLLGAKVTGGGTTMALNIGTANYAAGCYCHMWILGTVTGQVAGTVMGCDTKGGAYTDMAALAGTAASVRTVIGTVTSGSVWQYISVNYGTAGAVANGGGTMCIAISRVPQAGTSPWWDGA